MYIFFLFVFIITNCDNGETHGTTQHSHQWGNWTQTTAPNCTTEGTETRVCAINTTHKETRPIAINVTMHNWGSWIQMTAPTETLKGFEIRKCTYNSLHEDTRLVTVKTTGENLIKNCKEAIKTYDSKIFQGSSFSQSSEEFA